MTTTLSVINEFPSTKEQLSDFVSKTVAMVESGEVDALQLKAQLKFIERAIEEIDKQTKELQLKELSKYPKGVTELHGFKIEAMEAGIKIDYSVCRDTEWERLDSSIKGLSDRKKEREKLLKNITKPMQICDESTDGIEIIINPPLRTSTSSIKLTMV